MPLGGAPSSAPPELRRGLPILSDRTDRGEGPALPPYEASPWSSLQTSSAVDPGAVWMALDEATLLRPDLSISIATARWAPVGMRWAQREALLVLDQ